MSYRMPFPVPLLPAILVVACLGGIAMWFFRLVAAKEYPAHTKFALAQVTEFLNERSRTDLPTNEADLITILRTASIDWNSCKLNTSGMTDPWSVAIRTTFNTKDSQWTFRSSGTDRKFDTPDDIEAHTN